MLENKRVRLYVFVIFTESRIKGRHIWGTTFNDSYESPEYFSFVLDDKWSGDLKNDSISKLVLSGSC